MMDKQNEKFWNSLNKEQRKYCAGLLAMAARSGAFEIVNFVYGDDLNQQEKENLITNVLTEAMKKAEAKDG